MRKLSTSFLELLKIGFLSGITEMVRHDPDLSLEIRRNSCNVYFKGHSLLKLDAVGKNQYKAKIDPKFMKDVSFSPNFTEETLPHFLNAVPQIKQNIVNHGSSLEIEYEQLIIRANNFELHNNTEYFVVDRQYTVTNGRFDLLGIFWATKGRKRNQEVPLCLIEIKFSLNQEIQTLHDQVSRYYEAIQPRCAEIASELEAVFRQKLELGLYHQPKDRLEAMKTLHFSRNIEDFQFIIVLVDYNHNSSLLSLQKLASLPIANQIRIFHSGFALWQQNAKSLDNFLSEEL